MIESPCKGLCNLNEKGLCTGCYRTAREIRDWERLPDKLKLLVIRKSNFRGKIYNDEKNSEK